MIGPGSLAVWAQRVHDSTSADSLRFDHVPLPPLPGGAAALTRFLFSSVPQWVQIGGVILGAIVGVTLVVLTWKYRREILAWLASRSRRAKIALAATVLVAMGTVAGVGAVSWNFMMHDNDFCSSCHVMKSAFNQFRVSEHDKLQCHDCHRQSIFASSRELYYWVLDRPEKIPAHAPVPNTICQECHEQSRGAADSTWKRVIATAGHAVHFKSDTGQLQGLKCVDCHVREVHAFKAVDVGCQQSGCHDQVRVRLGAMANQSGMHCISCHDFGRPVSELLSVDSTRQAMQPARQQCTSCHAMEEKLAKHGLDKDPHKAQCATCHNPHEQDEAATAFRSCATSGCHSNPDTLTAFHRGLGTHRLEQCGSCHKPHTWKAASTRCIDCHRGIFDDRRADPAAPAASTGFAHATERRIGGPSDADAGDPGVGHAPAVVALRDTQPFRHSRHRKVACESCHRTDRRHGEITVKAPDGCQGCHHAADARAGTCATCHQPDELTGTRARATTMRISGRAAPIERALPFAHERHGTLACAACHAGGDPARVTTTCASCHENHHRADATCATCHADASATHRREAHLGCATCHVTPEVAALPQRRNVCLTCHRAQVDHKPGVECVACHRTGAT